MDESSGYERSGRWAFRFASVVVWATLGFVVAYVVLTCRVRIPQYVEGCFLFYAARVREHRPLWIDPIAGAWEYGPVPARYFVAYTGVWSYVLALFPQSWGALPGRLVSTLSWFGLLAGIALGARRPCRRATLLAAACAAGVYTSALFGSEARPDSLALLLSGLALFRSVRQDRVGFIEGALFASAAFVKPNVLGIAGGSLLGEVALRRTRSWPALLGAGSVSAAFVLVLHVLSAGQWFAHLTIVKYDPMRFGFWVSQALSGLQFFAMPLAFALWCAWRARKLPGALRALLALITSSAWTLLTIAKAAGARNYWMEPSVAAVVALSQAPLPELSPRARALGGIVAAVQSLWTGVASIRSSLEQIALAPAQHQVLESVRRTVGAGPSDVVLGEDPGIEWMLNLRIVQTPVYMASLGRMGLYPVELWVQDVSRPEIVGVVMLDDLLERPLAEQDVSKDVFLPELRAALVRRFALIERKAGVFVYGSRHHR